MFVKLYRILIRADTPEVWNPAIEVTCRFLDVVKRELEQDLQWPHAELSKLFSILLTILAEAGQYRHETFSGDPERRKVLDEDLLPKMGQLRQYAILVARQFLRQPVFSSLAPYIEGEIFPLLESMGHTSDESAKRAIEIFPLSERLGDAPGKCAEQARNRYMPFRVIQAGNVAERLYSLRIRSTDARLVGTENTRGLLREIYDCKYARFGTSGVRGRWGMDFTETRAKRVVQAICDYLKDSDIPDHVGAQDLQGKRIVIGYDSRRNARLVAEWMAQVFLANGFKVDLANRDTPTPALVYYLTDYLDQDDVAGLINCTASHNPPEWQGIKFNPRQGYPAPTSLTDFIAARANQLQLLSESASVADLSQAEERGDLRGFDPVTDYVEWILDSGRGNRRLSIDPERIREHFKDGCVIIDEMHGVSRGYLTRILGEIGVRYKIIHAERDPNLPGLDYANPEEPFINTLKDTVREVDDAILGLGMDTDGDRFGVVDKGGVYYRPNQVLPMLLKYLGVDRGETGRVISTQTGSPLIEVLAGMIPNNEQHQPEPNVVPAFVNHPFYHRRVGERQDRTFQYTFMVPVGIKYLEEQRRTNRRYQFLKELPDDWRDTILIGGEESSGLTTRGHVTDKDGIWGNLLIMDMVAYYGKSMAQIWKDTIETEGCCEFFGGRELDDNPSVTARADVDAVLEAKEALINDLLDRFEGKAIGEGVWADMQVVYAGGIRYDFVELQLRDDQGNDQHYLRARASGTEPINRIYVESSNPDVARRLLRTALKQLEELSAVEIQKAPLEWRLVDILSTTYPSDALIQVVKATMVSRTAWSREGIISKLERMLPTVERRNQRAIRAWIEALGNAK